MAVEKAMLFIKITNSCWGLCIQHIFLYLKESQVLMLKLKMIYDH